MDSFLDFNFNFITQVNSEKESETIATVLCYLLRNKDYIAGDVSNYMGVGNGTAFIVELNNIRFEIVIGQIPIGTKAWQLLVISEKNYLNKIIKFFRNKIIIDKQQKIFSEIWKSINSHSSFTDLSWFPQIPEHIK